jgi:hypothetical protein
MFGKPTIDSREETIKTEINRETKAKKSQKLFSD